MNKLDAVRKQCLFLLFLVILGCEDQNSKDLVDGSLNGELGNSVSSSAIYLSGGIGIDFGKIPVADKVLQYNGRNIRVVEYKFQEPILDIDAQVSELLENEGYNRKEIDGKGYKKTAVFQKPKAGSVFFRYKEVVEAGLKKVTILTVSWDV